ncbi:MAG TPA: Amuc_1100 family pilus-like protein [Verrucomicrobiales bacterium]|nr:Amuc_1100 family pilus-like protein [Verrucomicrobiales bacterium]
MLWLKKNGFLAGLLALAIVGIGGLGFAIFKGWKAAGEAKEEFLVKQNELQRLKGGRPFPDETNYRKWKEEVESYEASAARLRAEILDAQAKLDDVSDVRFQKDLSDMVAAIQEQAAAANVELPTDFYFGMASYETTLPRRDATGLLSFQLGAFQNLFTILFENGVLSVEGFYRKPLAVESEPPAEGARPPAASGARTPAEKPDPAAEIREAYPFEIAFSATQEGAMQILNAIANSPSHIMVVKFLRFENEKPEGPERSDIIVAEVTEPDFESSEDAETEDSDFGSAGASGLHFILGREVVRVYLNMDLVRFKQPDAVEVAQESR